MTTLKVRPRRLRATPSLRELVSETTLSQANLVMPYFVKEGLKSPQPIASMPGQFQQTSESLLKETEALLKTGVRSIILFGIPKDKDKKASGAYAASGVTQQAVKKLKKEFPELFVITDVCLCEYMSHGHCGVVKKSMHGKEFEVENDATLELLAQTALSHAQAGADMVAPSDMMDGRVARIRTMLDQKGFSNLPILSYAVKYASHFYGPFRQAAESAPHFGDRRSYQMDFRNSDEALREVELDLKEGADVIMVKPALAYLDVIYRIKNRFSVPVAAYNVSGEYALIKHAVKAGAFEEKPLVLEMLWSIRRAGANFILTYFAKQAALWLKR